MMDTGDFQSSVDLDDWWEDLTVEQRRAAFEAWQKSDIKSVFVTTDNTTHSQTAQMWDKNDPQYTTNYDEIRKQLASKVVWDQDRFKPWNDRLIGVNNDE